MIQVTRPLDKFAFDSGSVLNGTDPADRATRATPAARAVREQLMIWSVVILANQIVFSR